VYITGAVRRLSQNEGTTSLGRRPHLWASTYGHAIHNDGYLLISSTKTMAFRVYSTVLVVLFLVKSHQ
jgi:hypothetical protein